MHLYIKNISKLRLVIVFIGFFYINAYAQQGSQKSSKEYEIYLHNLALRLDKTKAVNCIAIANLGFARAKNSGMPQDTIDYFMGRYTFWALMLNDSGYKKGTPNAVQQEIQMRFNVADQTLSNSGIETMMNSCDNLFRVGHF